MRCLRGSGLLSLLILGACASSHPMGGGGGDDAGLPPDGGDVSPDAGGGPDGGVTERTCTTHFALAPTGAVTAVEVAGAWAWDARTPLVDPDGDGTWEAALDLDPGIWAYKLVVTRPGGTTEWILDPGNAYRAYDGGIENSAVRVPDCHVPLLEMIDHQVAGSGTAHVRVRVVRGAGGAPVTRDGVHVVLRHDASEAEVTDGVSFDGAVVDVSLAGLAAGKHTLVFDAQDGDGAAAEPLRVPFWVEADAFDWRDALIYMVMVDRFRDGDPSNDPGPTPGAEAAADYHGGDLRGVTQAIEDGTFDDLGVRALWLSPFVENMQGIESENGHGVTGYHGYWPVKARAVDPRLGTPADLDAMVTAAHAHGIRILMDFVINHVHEDHEYVTAHPDWFRTGCECGQPGCDWTTHRLDCSFHAYMPDVDWQNGAASEQIISDALWWLDRFDLDGLRVDAVKHVEDLAILNLSTRVHETFEQGGTDYFLLGETAMGWNGDDLTANLPEYETISRYIGPDALSGQFDFVLYHATAYRVWADDSKGMLHLDYWTRMSQQQYPAGAVMTPFVGSHDSERLVSLATYGSGSDLVHHKWLSQGLPQPPTSREPYDRAAIALTWLFTVPGAPLLYYGDEYGEDGGADPDNRHDWKPVGQRSAWQDEQYARVARAGRLRAELPALRRGDYRALTVTEDVLSFARTYQGQAAIVVINKSGAAIDAPVTVPADVTGDGTLTDRLDPGGRTVTVAGGAMTVHLPARSAAVLVP
ncbi:MAG: glycosyl hydrolase [Myxococcales bacterium]|nr:glycosyl hydrolase [Myxococcales bacterium]